jgi:transglutaminase-like putative cysteine protease
LQLALFLTLTVIASASAQVAAPTEDPFRKYGDTVVVKYRVGASIEAARGPVRDIVAMVAVPFESDEQEVIVTEEDISPEIDSVDYRIIGGDAGGGAKQMVISIPYLAGSTEAHAILTFEVRTRSILPSDEALTAQLVKPVKPDRELKKYLGRSPKIQFNHSKLKRTLREIFAEEKPAAKKDKDNEQEEAVELTSAEETEETEATQPAKPAAELTAWQRVEKIYDYVQGSIEYVEGEDQSALETLQSGKGDCHDISALFVALLRTDKIPARMVWVHEHQYPEFCLQDAEGKLHWFPCESSGMRAFGELPLARVIMQKGDNFHVPERPREALRYASEYLIGLPVEGSGKPKVKYIREQL